MASNKRLRVLTVSIGDNMGGAEKMARDLFAAYRERGHASWLAVGTKTSDDPDIFRIPNDELRGPWYQLHSYICERILKTSQRRPKWYWEPLSEWLWKESRPIMYAKQYLGWHDYNFPATRHLLRLPPERPDVIHCHNLHNDYFDLRLLPWFSRQLPVVVSLHDAWLLSGTCCHSFDCERWKTGCGECPYLSIWRNVARFPGDGTAHNWRTKRAIYARCRVHVTTACRWMMNKVEQSILAPGVASSRIIPYGVDQELFHPAEYRQAVRAAMDIPEDARVVFFVARFLKTNQSKDYQTLRSAIEVMAGRPHGRRLIFLARGAEAPSTEVLGDVEVRYFPWENEGRDVVRYYQAADVYVHPAKVDTFPLSVLEALSCGTPVVATAVGGIPEQVRSLLPGPAGAWEEHGPAEATGVLVPPGDVGAIVAALDRLLDDDRLRWRLGANAVREARLRFDMRQQVEDSLAWYAELLETAPQTSAAVRA